MSAHGLPRRQMLHQAGRRAASPQQIEQDKQVQQYPKQISATAETGDPTRSFKMLFQYEEAARYRSQEMQDQASQARLIREARLAERMRHQSENGARRARRALAGLFLG